MADSNPIIVGGGIGSGAPFAVGHLVYVTNTSPPQMASYPPMRLLDGAVPYTSVPNSAGVFVTVAGAAETWRVKGGAIIEWPAVDSVQIGRNITGLVGADQVIIGRGSLGSNLPGAVCVGSVSNLSGGASVVVGRNSGSGSAAPVSGVFIGDTAQASGNGGGANVVVIGDSALIALGGNPGGIGVAIGRLARVNHPSSVTIGDSAQSSLVNAAGQNTVTIGQSATSTKGGTTVVGGFATTVQTSSIVIGAQAQATNAAKTRSIVIGAGSTVAGTDCILVGGASALTSDSCMAFGAAAVDLGTGVLQLGTNGTQITTTIIGMGDTIVNPPAQLVRFTNASGADNAALPVTIQAALSTGNALPGTLVLAVGAQVAGSSAVVQTAGAGLTVSHTAAGGHRVTVVNDLFVTPNVLQAVGGIDVTGGSAASGRVGITAQNTVASGHTTLYFQNDRGAFASYGGVLVGGSASVAANFFGLTRPDKVFLIADGASMLGMALGTLTAQPLVFGTNNLERARIDGAGAVTFKVSLSSVTAIATPGAYAATTSSLFASTVSGAAIMGFGTTNDVSLLQKSGAVAAGVPTGTNGFVVTGGFGCNTKGAQAAYASGGALNAYAAGANGLSAGADMSALVTLVTNIRAALVANGIMS